MNKKRVLVCGATGFIGRNVAEKLAEMDEYQVVGIYHMRPCFANPKIEWMYADLRNKEYVELALEGVDIVIQAAAVTTGVKDVKEKPYIHVTDNIIMNALLMRAAYEHNVSQFVFLSCSVMYDQTKDVPLAEDQVDLNQPFFHAYFGGAWMKMYNEKACEFYSRLRRTRFLVVRHSNIYGPHDKFDLLRSHVFGATITKVMRASCGDKILVWGDGSERRDFLYVSDLVDFVTVALRRHATPFTLVNIGSGITIAVKDLIAAVIAHSGKKLEVAYDLSKPQVKTQVCLNIAKALGEFDWEPKTSLDEGIGKTIAWWKENVGR